MTYHDRLDRMESMMKTREDNDVIDHIGVVYIKNDTKLLWPIRLGANYDEN